MAMRGPLLRETYAGYYHREILAEDAELTHVGPATPAGEYLRRFWQPVAFSHEITDLPLALKIMGEELVLFRDGRGRVGLMELHCAHRGASLEFGRIEERGIRCCYHGWLYGVNGKILDTPGAPPDSTYKDRLCHGAYPTYEYNGLVFAYMGPPDRRPAFPVYDVFDLPGHRLALGPKRMMPCNWLQILDNMMDPVHLVFLHTISSGVQFTEAFGLLPETEFQETPVGTIYIDTRRVGDNIWVRTADVMLPNINQFAPLDQDGIYETIFNRPVRTTWTVPIDNTHTMRIGFLHIRDGLEERDWEKVLGNLGPESVRSYEDRQRYPGDDEAQLSQRPIAIHALEHLTPRVSCESRVA